MTSQAQTTFSLVHLHPKSIHTQNREVQSFSQSWKRSKLPQCSPKTGALCKSCMQKRERKRGGEKGGVEIHSVFLVISYFHVWYSQILLIAHSNASGLNWTNVCFS